MRVASFSRPAMISGPSVRERLLEAAKVEFSTRGYENTSTASLARLAGTSESQIMKHFGSKEELLATIFEEAWQRLCVASFQAFECVDCPKAGLAALVDL